MDKIDTSGMSCPQPVLMTKKALDKNPDKLDIIVDNTTARENVVRFLNKEGYSSSVKEDSNGFLIEAKK